jgi:hypothetical protein
LANLKIEKNMQQRFKWFVGIFQLLDFWNFNYLKSLDFLY